MGDESFVGKSEAKTKEANRSVVPQFSITLPPVISRPSSEKVSNERDRVEMGPKIKTKVHVIKNVRYFFLQRRWEFVIKDIYRGPLSFLIIIIEFRAERLLF